MKKPDVKNKNRKIILYLVTYLRLTSLQSVLSVRTCKIKEHRNVIIDAGTASKCEPHDIWIDENGMYMYITI